MVCCCVGRSRACGALWGLCLWGQPPWCEPSRGPANSIACVWLLTPQAMHRCSAIYHSCCLGVSCSSLVPRATRCSHAVPSADTSAVCCACAAPVFCLLAMLIPRAQGLAWKFRLHGLDAVQNACVLTTASCWTSLQNEWVLPSSSNSVE